MKLWGGRFKTSTHQLVEDYNASIEFDYQLAPFDIQGSLAHVKMLGHCHILQDQAVSNIISGLKKLQQLELKFTIADEDVHMNIERSLYELIGEDAKKLHTGRSRNDQVALDMHLYVRFQILQLIQQLHELQTVLLDLAQEHVDVLMPGYTHLQRAEPVRFAQHMLAYFNMFYRDMQRLMQSFAAVNVCPLGAGALAGSGVAVDREFVAQLLNFDAVYENSLDAVSNRDFVAEFLFNASLIMMHFSKFSEEIILWSSQEFAFIQLSDEFCTGSSMMPQKKNPDVAELARGKTGRVYGALMGLLTMLKGLPLAYNKDMQEDKEGLFDTVKTLQKTLAVYAPMLSSMQINKVNMHNAVHNDYANATQVANYLVQKHIPFREAHAIAGKIVLHCIENAILLSSLSLADYQKFCLQIDRDIYQFIAVLQVVEAHAATGGTAKKSVLNQIQQAKARISEVGDWLSEKMQILEVKL